MLDDFRNGQTSTNPKVKAGHSGALSRLYVWIEPQALSACLVAFIISQLALAAQVNHNS